jgi:hypothetical protein
VIDRHYGHLAKHRREYAISLLDALTASEAVDVHAAWTLEASPVVHSDNEDSSWQEETESPLADSNRRPSL